MTLINTFHSNDDQQVPDTRFDVVALGSTTGGTVIKSHKLSSPSKPTLPDFSSLLQEPEVNSTSLDTPDIINCSLDLGYPASKNDQSSDSLMEKPTYWSAIDDLSLYDGLQDLEQKPKLVEDSIQATPVRPTTLTLLPQALPPAKVGTPSTVATIPSPVYSTLQIESQNTQSSPSESVGFESFDEETIIPEQVYAEIDDVCRNLWIPKNPHHWSAEHVQKWAIWALRQHYNIEKQFLPEFVMDGTTLCMLSQEEFRNRSADCGYYLFAELDWWKTVTNEEPVYTDLSNSNSSVMSTIPTPVLSELSLSQPTPVPQMDNDLLLEQQQQQFSFLNSLTMDDDSPMMSTINDVSLAAGSVDLMQTVKTERTTEESISMSDEEDEDNEHADVSQPRRYVSHSKHTIHLWQFLKELLMCPESFGNYIKWIDRSKGIFKIENSAHVAKLWGRRKNRPAMNYDKLSRSIRQYYKKGIIKKTSQSKRLVYQFQPNYL